MDARAVDRAVIEQFRAGGEIQGMHRDRLVLLTTTGARTGKPRTTPMMFHRDDGRVLVIASNQGAPRHPNWYFNLLATPRVIVELADQTYEADAVPLGGKERESMWSVITGLYPFFIEHEATAGRKIPVVALNRVD